MIANPKTMLLGAAAQFGIFFAFLGAILLGFNGLEAASIGIIGGADGPTATLLNIKISTTYARNYSTCSIFIYGFSSSHTTTNNKST